MRCCRTLPFGYNGSNMFGQSFDCYEQPSRVADGLLLKTDPDHHNKAIKYASKGGTNVVRNNILSQTITLFGQMALYFVISYTKKLFSLKTKNYLLLPWETKAPYKNKNINLGSG